MNVNDMFMMSKLFPEKKEKTDWNQYIPVVAIFGGLIAAYILFKDQITGTAGSVVDAVGSAWDGVTSTIGGGVDAIGGVAGDIYTAMGGAYETAGGAVESAGSWLTGGTTMYEAVSGWFSGLFGGSNTEASKSDEVTVFGQSVNNSKLNALKQATLSAEQENDNLVRDLMSKGYSVQQLRNMGYDTLNFIGNQATYDTTVKVPAYLSALTGISGGVLEVWNEQDTKTAYIKVDGQYVFGGDYEQILNKVAVADALLADPTTKSTGNLTYDEYKEVYEAATGQSVETSKAFFEGTKYKTKIVETYIKAAAQGDAAAANWLRKYAPTAADNVAEKKQELRQEAYEKLLAAMKASGRSVKTSSGSVNIAGSSKSFGAGRGYRVRSAKKSAGGSSFKVA